MEGYWIICIMALAAMQGVTAVDLEQPCTGDTDCTVAESFCAGSGNCECRFGYTPNGVTACDVHIDPWFHCNRNTIDCGSTEAVCDKDQGICDCSAASIQPTNDRNPCIPNAATACTTKVCNTEDAAAVCFNDGGTETCYCSDAYYGDTCTSKRVVIQCDTDRMTVSVTPFGAPPDVFNVDQKTNCMLTKTGDTFSRTYKLDGTAIDGTDLCLGQVLTESFDNGDTDVSVKLKVKFNADIMVKNDLIVIATCRYTAEVDVAPQSITKILATDENFDERTGEEEAALIFLAVEKEDGTTLIDTTDEASLGETISIIAFMPIETDSLYKDFLVLATKIDDGKTPAVLERQLVSDVGCQNVIKGVSDLPHTKEDSTTPPTSIAGTLTGTGTKVTITFYGFIFEDDAGRVDGLRITLKAQMCATSCTAPTCPSDSPTAFGRRKREADTEEVELSAFIKIGSGSSQANFTRVSGTAAKSGEECLKEPATQTLVAVLGVAVLVLLVAVLVLAFCFLRRQRRHGKLEDFADHSSTMTSSTQHLAIPRPKV